MKSFKQYLAEASKTQILALKDHFKSTEGLTDGQVDPYVDYWDNIISKLPDGTIESLNKDIDPKEVKNILSFLPSKKVPQPKLSFKDLEQLVDAHKGRQEYTGREKEQIGSSGEEDIIYNKNNLIIKKGHSRQSCITHGKGHTWCISRPDSSNLYTRYRFDPDQLEPTFYFVYDKDKPNNDPWFHVVIYVRNDGSYVVALAHNPGDQEMSWNEIIQNQPKLKGLEKLFKHVPLTTDEKEMYGKFKKRLSDKDFLKLNLKEMDFYVSLGHNLSENVMLELLKERATKAILNNYVIHQWLLPKKVYDKLTDGQKKKIEENQLAAVKEYYPTLETIIKAGIEPSERVLSAAIDGGWYYPPKEIYDKLSEELKEKVKKNQLAAVTQTTNAGYAIKKIIDSGVKLSIKFLSVAIDGGWYDPPKEIYDKLTEEQKKKIEKNQFDIVKAYGLALEPIINAGFEPSENLISVAIDGGLYDLPKQIYDKLSSTLKEKVEKNQITKVKKNWMTTNYIKNIFDSVIKYIINHHDKSEISDMLRYNFKSQETKQKLQAAFDKKYK